MLQWGGSDAFVAKNSDATSWHELLHWFVPFCTEFCRATKWFRMHPNSTKRTKKISLGSNWVDQMRSLRKIPKPLRGTNFCTILARFAPSFVTQPNGHKCTKIVQNRPKHEFRVQWGGLGALVAKNCYATSWHKLLHQFVPFCTEFRRSTKRSLMHQNCTKCTRT